MPKFIEPMFSEHISGEACSGAASRCSTVIIKPPPVVMLTTASQFCLMRGRNCMNTAGSGVGRPVCGSRACRWRIAAPASAAAIACSAISFGVIGQAIRHRRRVDAAGHRAGDDDLVRRAALGWLAHDRYSFVLARAKCRNSRHLQADAVSRAGAAASAARLFSQRGLVFRRHLRNPSPDFMPSRPCATSVLR